MLNFRGVVEFGQNQWIYCRYFRSKNEHMQWTFSISKRKQRNLIWKSVVFSIALLPEGFNYILYAEVFSDRAETWRPLSILTSEPTTCNWWIYRVSSLLRAYKSLHRVPTDFWFIHIQSHTNVLHEKGSKQRTIFHQTALLVTGCFETVFQKNTQSRVAVVAKIGGSPSRRVRWHVVKVLRWSIWRWNWIAQLIHHLHAAPLVTVWESWMVVVIG